jgi:flagellar hook-associated protein 3 FlgL
MTMTTSFVSSQYLANALVAPVNAAQSALSTATAEMTSGEYADIGLRLGDQSGYELALKGQVAQLSALTSSNSVVAARLSTADAALTSIATAATTAAKSLVSAMSGSTANIDIKSIGDTALASLVASANATYGGVYVFGGINSSEAPLAEDFSSTASAARTAIDNAFESTFGMLPTDASASTITASQITSFLSGTAFTSLFSGTNWASNWSSASSTNVTATIAPGQTATVSVNANDQSFQQLTQAFAMLSEFGDSALSDSAKQAVISASSTLIATGQNSLTALQASAGVMQSAVTNANTAMSTQSTLLQTQIGKLDDVDQNAISAKIVALQTQIQMAYELTSKLQSLSLAKYL